MYIIFLLLHLSLFRLLLADVLLHAVVQDALHPEAVHPCYRRSYPNRVLTRLLFISFLSKYLPTYRAGHELPIEGSLHDFSKERLAQHLLAKLHQLKIGETLD